MATRNFSRLRRLSFLFIRTKGQSSNKSEVISKTFLFMGNMSPYYFKTIFTLCMEGIPSFIKIGGAVSEKKRRNGQTFVVLYIGFGLSKDSSRKVSCDPFSSFPNKEDETCYLFSKKRPLGTFLTDRKLEHKVICVFPLYLILFFT